MWQGIAVKEKLPCFSLTDSFCKTVGIGCRSHLLRDNVARDWKDGKAVPKRSGGMKR
ncbi:hypothetical protein [Treponema pectinovorum]|uniref:hypothetical protein n=1 Tax=Treponema pectinovorum TaxID=164 RepID=UPI00164ED572|nr:hypothetical protein [Treponema pectinovorum]